MHNSPGISVIVIRDAVDFFFATGPAPTWQHYYIPDRGKNKQENQQVSFLDCVLLSPPVGHHALLLSDQTVPSSPICNPLVAGLGAS